MRIDPPFSTNVLSNKLCYIVGEHEVHVQKNCFRQQFTCNLGTLNEPALRLPVVRDIQTETDRQTDRHGDNISVEFDRRDPFTPRISCKTTRPNSVQIGNSLTLFLPKVSQFTCTYVYIKHVDRYVYIILHDCTLQKHYIIQHMPCTQRLEGGYVMCHVTQVCVVI